MANQTLTLILTLTLMQAILRGEPERYVAQILAEMMGASMLTVYGSSPLAKVDVEAAEEDKQEDAPLEEELTFLFGHLGDGLTGAAVTEEAWVRFLPPTIALQGGEGRWDNSSGCAGAGLIRAAFTTKECLLSSLVHDRLGAFDPKGLFCARQDCPADILRAETLLAVPLVSWDGHCKGVATFINRRGTADAHFAEKDQHHMRGIIELLTRYVSGPRPARPRLSPALSDKHRLLLAERTGLFEKLKLMTLPHEEKVRIVLEMVIQTVPEGRYILRDEEIAPKLFMVDSGEVLESRIAKDTKEGSLPTPLRHYRAGTHFGADGVVNGAKSTTDFMATTKVRLMVLTQPTVDACPALKDFLGEELVKVPPPILILFCCD